MKKHINTIKLLIEECGETEDLQRDLSLVTHYLQSAVDKKEAYSVIKEGIKMKIPIPYIIGYTLVCGLKMKINKSVLHPGPETITLIEKAIEYIQASRSKSILDLCTGSGSVAIVIAKKCNVKVVASDISNDALEIARFNAFENNAEIEFLAGNLFEPLQDRRFDVIITNPPYVKSNSIQLLPSFIRDFAPTIAIDGGDDGLFFHKTILSQAKSHSSCSGRLFIECEDGQDYDIVRLCHQFQWNIEEKFKNRNGNVRGFMLSYSK